MTGEFVLRIDLGNASMQDQQDLGLALIAVGEKLYHAEYWGGLALAAGTVRDANGNSVGRWEVQ